MQVEAQPHVQLITFWPSASAQLDESVDISCSVTLRLSKSGTTQAITMSPFAAASLLEAELNQINLVTQVGLVSVLKTGYQGSPSSFWSTNDAAINLEIVFATNYSVSEGDIPAITLDPSVSCASSLELSLNTSSTVTQTLTSTTSFMVGFNNTLSVQTRTTSQVSVDTTPKEFQQKMTELLSWGCMEEERISAMTDMYETYETSSTNRDDATSFCGFKSKNNPRTVRGSSDSYTLTSIPYVSC